MRYYVSAAVAMAALLSFTPAISPASAETENCTEITALPFTITAQGIYCLKQNLNVNLATGNAITVNAGNVTIEFNGWRVNNQAALATTEANGVFAANRKNITLRDGFIRGFENGVFLDETVADASGSHLVEDMKIADSAAFAMIVEGDLSIVRNNRVIGVGGGSNSVVFGINLQRADDGAVTGNIVTGVSGTTGSTGIAVGDSNRVHVFDNVIAGISGSAADAGINVFDSSAVTMAGNRLLNDAASGENGILDTSSSGLSCLDNDIGGYATPLSGCDVDNGNRVLFN